MAQYGGSPDNSDLYFSAELQDNVSPAADQIEKRLKALGASKHEIKLFLKAYDEATPKIKAAQEHLNKLGKDRLIHIRANTDQIDQAHRKLEKLREIAKAPYTVTVHVKDNLDEYINKLKMKFNHLEYELKNSLKAMPLTAGLLGATGTAYNMVSGPLSTATGLPFSSLGVGAGGLGIGAGMAAFFTQSFKQNAQLEQDMARLNQITRSPAATRTAYGQVVQTATHTPFNMPDVLQSYIQMSQMGTNPSHPAYGIKAAANLGAGAQVPISRATGALQQSSLGYFTELNTLTGRNIRQSDFTYGGRYSGQTYEQATLQVLKQYQNASQTQMQTFKGLMTNIQDVITQKVVLPAGKPLFEAGKGLEQRAAGFLGSPQNQLAMAREVDKIQEGLIKMFKLVQQGHTYFRNSLEQPLKQITASVATLGAAFGKTFAGTMVTGVKYLSEALTTIITPIAGIAKQLPVLGQLAGLMKALHMFGISTNTGLGNIFKGLGTLNPLRMLEGFRQLFSLLGKIGLYQVVKSFLDMKNANDQLDASFKSLGSGAEKNLDKLKVGFDALIFKANALGKSVAQLKTYGAIAAEGVGANKNQDPHGTRLAQVARFGALDIAKLSAATGMGGLDTAHAFQTWEKQLGAGHQIYDQGKSPRSVMDSITRDIYQSAQQLHKALGISLKDAVNAATTALQLFKKELSAADLATPRGASAAAGIYAALSSPYAMTGKDSAKFGGPGDFTRYLLSSAKAPGVDLLQSAMGARAVTRHGITHYQFQSPGVEQWGLNRAFDFKSRYPNLHGAHQQEITDTLNQYANVTTSSQQANRDMLRAIGPQAGTISKYLPGGLQLPQFKNVLSLPIKEGGLGLTETGKDIKHMNTAQSAQEILRLSAALNNVQTQLEKVNREITKNQNELDKWNVMTEQAQAALAHFNLGVEKQQNAIDQWQLNLQKLQTDAMDPLQRAIARLSQKSADYQQHAILPVQRAQEDWNQAMLLTSHRLEDVSFSMQKAQFNMEKFNGGMLTGENALTAQIESLTVYNKKLDMLRLQNMGLQADITKTQFHQGFTSTVKPLMGFTLQREIQLGQEREQMLQDTYDTTYGHQHWQLQRAGRTKFQAQEMTFAQRMAGTIPAAAQISKGTEETMAIQIQQYAEQLKSRELEKKMYAVTVGARGLQDQQYALNKRAFELQQRMSLESSRIARATESIQQKQLPLQHALNHMQNITTIKTASIDLKNLVLNQRAGALTNAVPDLHDLFGKVSEQFNKNIGTGGTVIGHLALIAKLLGASPSALHAIEGGAHGGDAGHGGGPGGPGWFKSILNNLSTNPLTWGQAGWDIAKHGFGAISGIGGGGILGSIAGAGVMGAGGLALINAGHVAGVRGIGALGQGLAGHGRDMRFDNHAFTRFRGSIYDHAGSYLSGLREGAPWKMALHPSAFLRQLPASLAGFGTFGAFSAAGHPVVGAGAAKVADTWVDKRLGVANFDPETGKYRHGVITRGAYHLATHPIRTVKGWGSKAAEDLGKVATASQATAEEVRKTGFWQRAQAKVKAFSITDPGIVGIAEKNRVAGLGALGADITDNIKVAANRAAGATGTVGVSKDEHSFGASLKESAKSFGRSAAAIATDGQARTSAMSSLRESTSRIGRSSREFVSSSAQASRDRIAAHRDQVTNADRQARTTGRNAEASHTAKKAADEQAHNATTSRRAANIEHDGAKILHDGSGKFGEHVKSIAGHFGRFGRIVGRFSGIAGLFSFAATVFGDNTHFLNGITKAFNSGVHFMNGIVRAFDSGVNRFVEGIGKFLTHLGKFLEKLHLPSGGVFDDITSAVGKGARWLGDKAGDVGDKAIHIGGQVLKWGGRAAGVASFVPGIIDLIKGNTKGGIAQILNSLEYFGPAQGFKILHDITGLKPKTPGAGGVHIPGGADILDPSTWPGLRNDKAGIAEGDRARAAEIAKLRSHHKNMVELWTKNGQHYINIITDNREQEKRLRATWNKLSLSEQEEFHTAYNNNQTQALTAALSGPNGLKSYLHNVNSRLNTHWTNRLQGIHNAYDSENKGHNAGYKAISGTTGSWLGALTRQIETWAKQNGVPLTHSKAEHAAHAVGGAASAVQSAASGIGSFFQSYKHGGLVDADAHKIGPGRTVRMVEEGHPEVVIPLAPHRRDRAKSLIEHTKALIGYASGGVVHPHGKRNKQGELITHGDLMKMAVGGYVWPYSGGITSGRVDEGWDMGGAGQIAAIGDTGPLLPGQRGWPGTGQGFYYQLMSGIRRGQYVYVYENIARRKALGQTAKAGEVIANLLPGYPHLESGWATASGAPTAQGHYSEGQITAEGLDFQHFLEGLSHGKLFGGGAMLGGINAPPIKLKGIPAALKRMGAVGLKQHAILKHAKDKWEKFLNSQSMSTGNLSTTGGGTAAQNQALAHKMLLQFGFGEDQWPALKALWTQESNWTTGDTNPSSGAYGIPQALPASKMASAGADWRTNPATQIKWGLQYIKQRYGSPAAAEAHELAHHWYAGGIPRVARDNTLAMLHEGEKVLPAGQVNQQSGPSKTEYYLDQISKTLSDIKLTSYKHLDLTKQQLLRQINAEISATGPKAHRLDMITKGAIHADEGSRGSPFGNQGGQASNLVNNLIAQLHNLPGKHGRINVADELAKAQDYRARITYDKKHHLSAAADKKHLHQLEAAIHSQEVNFVDQGMKRGIAKRLLGYAVRHVADTDNHGVTTDAQLAAIPRMGLYTPGKHGRVPHLGIDHHRHPSIRMHTTNRHLQGLKTYAKKTNDYLGVIADTNNKMYLAQINAQIKGAGPGLHHDLHLVGRTIDHAKRSHAEHKKHHHHGHHKHGHKHGHKHHHKHGKGVHHVHDKHNEKHHKHGLNHLKHLHDLHKKHHGKVDKHHSHTHKHHGNVDKHHNHVQKHHTHVEKYHSHVLKHHEHVHKYHETVKKHHERVHKHHDKVEKYHGIVGKHHGAVAHYHEAVLKHHDKVVKHHENVHTHHALVGKHHEKVEKAHTEAAKARDTALKTHDKHHVDNVKQHNESHTHHKEMIKHLNKIANKVEKLNPVVQNNITLEVSVDGSGNVKQKQKAPKNK